jgi:iron(III) transport system substrate-binding protein
MNKWARVATRIWLMVSIVGSFYFASLATAQTGWEKTVAAAKKEGRVVVAGPPPAGHREAIVKFQQAFPEIHLEYTGMDLGTLDTRVSREREVGQYLWDVVVSGFGPTVFVKQIPGGWFDPLKPAVLLPDVADDRKWLGGFDGGFLDKGKKFAYGFALYVTASIYVNEESVPEGLVQKVEDLLNPRWSGKVAWYDPLIPGPGGLIFAHLRKLLGDEALKRLVVDSQAVITKDSRQLTEWLVRGRYPIVFGAAKTDVATFQREGLGAKVKRLRLSVEPVTPGWGGVLLVNRAPHPNAAKVFINWLLGREAQADWALGGAVNSRRLDVPAGDPDILPDPKRLDGYNNLSNEENALFRVDAIKFAKTLIK